MVKFKQIPPPPDTANMPEYKEPASKVDDLLRWLMTKNYIYQHCRQEVISRVFRLELRKN